MNDCWIKPNGQIVEIGQMQHNMYAGELLEEEMGLEGMMNYIEENNMNYPYEVLHQRGWIRVKVCSDNSIEIFGDCVDLTRPMRNTIDPAMNQVQIRIAKMLCEESNTEFHKAINDRRFW